MKRKTLLFLTTIISAATIQSQVIHVPADQPTIQAGIEAASDGDTVLVAEGTWTENIRFLGKAITVASAYLIDQDESHIENTIIDGSQATNPDSAATVMFIDGEDTTSVICGFTITGGTGVHNDGWNVQHGGGVALENSGATIIHNIITGNIVEADFAAGGCGISAFSESGDEWVVIRNNTIIDNDALASGLSAFGGGIACTMNSFIQDNLIEYNSCENIEGNGADGGGIEIECPDDDPIMAEIKGNTIRHNSLEALNVGMGGGIVIAGTTHSHISENLIENNTVSSVNYANAGGIYVYALAGGDVIIEHNDILTNTVTSEDVARGSGICIWEPLTDVSILNNTIEGNTLSGDKCLGGGIWSWQPLAELNITGNLIKNNTGPLTGMTVGYGGGITILDGLGELVVDKNIFCENTMCQGGGLYLRNSSGTIVSNNVFKGNNAVTGGGIHYYCNSSEASLGIKNPQETWPLIVNNTLIENVAMNGGGGLWYFSEDVQPVMFNCIIRDNIANTGPAIYSQYNNQFLVDHCNVNTADIYGNWAGVGNIDEDITFLDDSCHLAPGCVCVEAGTPFVEFNYIVYECPDHDIDGDARPLNGTADIGVDEVLLTALPGKQRMKDKLFLTNQPNPFNGQTMIEFNLHEPGPISLTVTDIKGRLVTTLLDESFGEGTHRINWLAENLDEGIYFLNLTTRKTDVTRKMILLGNQ